MQLLIILAMLLYGGKNPKNLISEVKPVLETFGGEEIKEAIKSAEEITEMLSAVKEFTGTAGAVNAEERSETAHSMGATPKIAFPLEPISAVADKDITYSLSKYISAKN